MYQLCKGVAFIYSCGVLHHDIKPHNLLMDRRTRALKIANLILSRAFTVPLKMVWSPTSTTPATIPV
jgi:cyclin-dependent kinase